MTRASCSSGTNPPTPGSSSRSPSPGRRGCLPNEGRRMSAATIAAEELHPGFLARRQHFGDVMDFYAPGLKKWSTPEWTPTNPQRFLPVSVTGSACALSCDHCQTKVLDGMAGIPAGETLFDT